MRIALLLLVASLCGFAAPLVGNYTGAFLSGFSGGLALLVAVEVLLWRGGVMSEQKKNGCHNGPPPVDEVVVREESPLISLSQALEPGSVVRSAILLLAINAPPRIAYPNRLAKDCQYTKSDLGRTDPGCFGCNRRLE